jgi:hypothetical protein
MKSKVAGWLLLFAVTCTLMAGPAMAQYPGGRPFGAYDNGHVWRDAGWWHTNNPQWMYSYHPEWAVERRDWWQYDHQYHPDWFWAPFWGLYPLWSWGAPYQGVYHDYWWWHQYHPDWMYANHPEWAEPYGGWLRDDYAGHPGWFTSNYWREHPRDWANPGRAFWNRQNGRFNNYLNEHPERRSQLSAGAGPGGARGQERGVERGPEHAGGARGQERGVERGPEHAGGARGQEHAGGAERGARPGGGHPNEASRGATHNAPHEASHAEHHEGAGGSHGGEREKK